MSRLLLHTQWSIALIAVVAMTTVARADDKAKDKPNPTGPWKWSIAGKDGQSRETTLKLKLDGDKLTGSVTGRNNTETSIEEGKYKDGELSFQVTRERNGEKFTIKYTGKVSGDAITGKTQFGDREARDWKAERVKEEKK